MNIFNKHGLSAYPTVRRATMTTEDLRRLLLETPRPVLLNGLSYDIKNKCIGPDVYEVWLKRWKHGG